MEKYEQYTKLISEKVEPVVFKKSKPDPKYIKNLNNMIE